MSEIPADLYYTEEHEWVQRTGDDTVRVGITDYAQSALGDVVFVQLADPAIAELNGHSSPSAAVPVRGRARVPLPSVRDQHRHRTGRVP